VLKNTAVLDVIYCLLTWIKTTQPNFQPCTQARHNSRQIHEIGHDQPIITCTGCHKLTCFTHRQPWHTGMACTVFDSSSARLAADQEVQTLKIINATTKCPSCEVRTQKHNGCDHMRCMTPYTLLGSCWLTLHKQAHAVVMSSVGSALPTIRWSGSKGMQHILPSAHTIACAFQALLPSIPIAIYVAKLLIRVEHEMLWKTAPISTFLIILLFVGSLDKLELRSVIYPVYRKSSRQRTPI
jgi:hypothetical protein